MLRLRKCFCTSPRTINEAITNYGIPSDWIFLNSDSSTIYGIPGFIFFPGKMFACSTNFLFPYTDCWALWGVRRNGIFFHFLQNSVERDFFSYFPNFCGTGFFSFFSKSQNFRAPLLKFNFLKIVLRTYMQIFRPIRPTI